jgi:four helix bundle protein
MKSYKDLEVWQVAMDLVEEIYKLTSAFPKEEQYGLTSQVRRASTSIVANIAEGFGRFTFPDKAHTYTIVRGECTEVEAYLLVAIRVLDAQSASTPVLQYSSTLR